MCYSVTVTALLICSNIALALYVQRFGLQCVNSQTRNTNCSHELQLGRESVQLAYAESPPDREKPVAHLTGLKVGNLSQEVNLQPLEWDFQTGMAYSNMGYEGGHLWIPRSGLYYVYSQVAFYLPSCGEVNAGILTHNVYKWTDSYPEAIPLLAATKSVCEGGKGDWHVTISQGALFPLLERDRIFVTVNRAAMVEHMEQKTFFGAFML
ncbi:tumor necrosis factor ligand superfamily member 15-like [Mustelus asterias]